MSSTLNQAFRAWGHDKGYLYDFEEFQRVALEAGFQPGEIRRASFHRPKASPLSHLDKWWRSNDSFYVELHRSADGRTGGVVSSDAKPAPPAFEVLKAASREWRAAKMDVARRKAAVASHQGAQQRRWLGVARDTTEEPTKARMTRRRGNRRRRHRDLGSRDAGQKSAL